MDAPPGTFWGKPCKRGHNAPRRIDSKACTECLRDRSKRQHAEIKSDPIKWTQFQDRMRANDVERKIVREAIWLEKRGIVAQKPVVYAEQNPEGS